MRTTARMPVEVGRGRYKELQVDDLERQAPACYIEFAKSFDDLLGLEVLGRLRQSSDAVVLLTCRFIRMYAYGYLAAVLVVYLTSIGFSTATSGSIFTWTLIGDAVVSLYLTTNADKIGRRKTLIYSSVLSLATAIIFAMQNNYWLILITAAIGVISPSGNEIGPFMAIEQSSLKQVIIAKDSVRAQAWYNFVGSMATALGSLSCGISIDVFQTWGLTTNQSYQGVMIIYAFLQTFLICGFHFLGPRVELPEKTAIATGVVCSTAVEDEEPVFLGLRKSKIIVVQLSILSRVLLCFSLFVPNGSYKHFLNQLQPLG
jgi:MFS family permease